MGAKCSEGKGKNPRPGRGKVRSSIGWRQQQYSSKVRFGVYRTRSTGAWANISNLVSSGSLLELLFYSRRVTPNGLPFVA